MVFMTPKPLELLKRIITLATEPGDTVLDSFAGSGTTAHAILDLSKSDLATRKFVLVQIPYDTTENAKDQRNICETVTTERVRRVIDGYKFSQSTDNGGQKNQTIEGTGGEFSYVRLGEPLVGEYRDLSSSLPSYHELAKYIFYTETSRDFDPKAIIAKTGKIGEKGKQSYYLLYTPNNNEDRRLDL